MLRSEPAPPSRKSKANFGMRHLARRRKSSTVGKRRRSTAARERSLAPQPRGAAGALAGAVGSLRWAIDNVEQPFDVFLRLGRGDELVVERVLERKVEAAHFPDLQSLLRIEFVHALLRHRTRHPHVLGKNVD